MTTTRHHALTTPAGAPATGYAGLLIDRTDHGHVIFGDPTSDEAMALLELWQRQAEGGLLVDRAITERLGAALAVAPGTSALAAWRTELGLAIPPGDDEVYCLNHEDTEITKQ